MCMVRTDSIHLYNCYLNMDLAYFQDFILHQGCHWYLSKNRTDVNGVQFVKSYPYIDINMSHMKMF